MEKIEDEVVQIRVCEKHRGDVVFEGKVSTAVAPDELVRLNCFCERGLRVILMKSTNERVRCLKDQDELVAVSGDYVKEFSGVLFVGHDGVLRKSKVVPLLLGCVKLSVWRLSHDECEKVFLCEQLEELEVRFCELSHFPNDLVKMKAMKRLRLIGLKQLKSIPETLVELPNLKELWVSGCGIESLPKNIGGMKQMEKVTLWLLSALKCIPEGMGNLSSLKELRIDGCGIASLPMRIGGMKHLEKMRLEYLKMLKSIPDDIGDLSCLKELVIESCYMDRLPKSMGSMKHLETLTLRLLVKLKSIPEEIGELTSLTHLMIRSCGILSLPKRLKELKNLESLVLDNLLDLQFYPDDMEVFSKLKKEFHIHRCNNAFASVAIWNPVHAFCQVIKMSVSLEGLWAEVPMGPLDFRIGLEALQQNGSIVDGNIHGIAASISEGVFKRNKDNHERALASVVCLLALRRMRLTMCDMPKEVVKMIARHLWITRCDVDAWRRVD